MGDRGRRRKERLVELNAKGEVGEKGKGGRKGEGKVELVFKGEALEGGGESGVSEVVFC